MNGNPNMLDSKAEQKEKIRNRYKNSNIDGVEMIPAKPRPKLFEDDDDKRVAVYARVSTLATQQTSSFELQQKHYTDFVDRQSGWELVKIYSDEGISGTSLNRREGFKEMIEDCKKGGIDLIRNGRSRRPGIIGYAEAMIIAYNKNSKSNLCCVAGFQYYSDSYSTAGRINNRCR